MALAFPRSLRSLKRDSFRPSLITLSITIVLVVAWCVWFLFSAIPMYEASTNFSVQRDGSLQVSFGDNILKRLQAGSPATLEIKQSGGVTKYNGTVMDILPSNRTRTGAAYIIFDTGKLLKPDTQGQVQIQIESITPAQLLLRAIQSGDNAPAK